MPKNHCVPAFLSIMLLMPSAVFGQPQTKPTPAEIIVQALNKYEPKDLSFEDWALTLEYRDASPANRAAADKVWAWIRTLQKNGAARLKLLKVKVVKADRYSLDISAGPENAKKNIIDLHASLAEAVSAPPAPGTIIAIEGEIYQYRAKPFLFSMRNAAIRPDQ